LSFKFGSYKIADSSHLLLWLADKFTDGEENKIEYTDLFQTYTIIIEKSLDDELKAKIPVSMNICNTYYTIIHLSVSATHSNALFIQDFDMTKFEALLVDRKGENHCIFSSNTE
jgi:The ARF-like 2 binding protein BART